MIFKKKVKVTPEQLGTALFYIAFKCAKNNLESEKIVGQIGIQGIDAKHLMREMIIINMFGITLQLNGVLKNEMLEDQVLNHLHNAYRLYLAEELNYTDGAIIIERNHVASRYKQYRDAMSEKRGPNWLWPVTHHMLDNLRREDTKDMWGMVAMVAVFGELAKAITKIISRYQVIEN